MGMENIYQAQTIAEALNHSASIQFIDPLIKVFEFTVLIDMTLQFCILASLTFIDESMNGLHHIIDVIN